MKKYVEDSTSYAKLDLFQPDTAHRELFEATLERSTQRIARLIPQFGLRNPRLSEPGSLRYKFCRPREWVAGFWPGQLWLAFALTGQSVFRNSARMRRPYFERFIGTPSWHNHDLGFLFSLSTVADWKLTGNQEARDLALRAAEALALRWRQPMPCLTCWNPLPHDDEDFARRKAGMVILDSVENMGLLFWAAQETGNADFAEIAQMHLDTCQTYLVREDYSTFHCYEFDPSTGAPLRGSTHQGYADDSCWARGQAWGIHGFTLAYQATGKITYRETALGLADYVEQHLPKDSVPQWDYALPADGSVPRDSSAGAITAAGLYALAEAYADDPGTAHRLTQLADRMLVGLVHHCDLTKDTSAQGLLGDATAFFNSGLSDGMVPYGDYFYVEALMRALGHSDFFWL